MDAATTGSTTPPSGSAGAPHRGRNDPPQLPANLPVSVVAQRRVMKSGGVGSSVRRSPRLSRISPLRPPTECQDMSSGDESESINDVPLHLSREETPDNDVLPPDEPSTVLANRILRAHDNPSPPPQDVAHHVIDYITGKGDQFPSQDVSAPPSPFRPINLLERLNQSSDPLFGPPHSLSSSGSGDRPDASDSSILPPRGFPPSEPCSPSFTPVPMKGAAHEDLVPIGMFPSSPTQYTVDGLPSRPSQHVCEPPDFADDAGVNLPSQPAAGLYGQQMTMINSIDSEASRSSSTHVVDSLSNSVVPSASAVCFWGTFPSSGRQSYREASPIVPNATTLSSSPSNGDGKALPATEMTVDGGQDKDKDLLSLANNDLSVSKEEQETKYAKDFDANLHQRLDSLSLHSVNVLLESNEQEVLPAEPTCIKHPPATPPQTPRPSLMYPDISGSTVQRPVVAPTPVRENNNARKFTSPAKFSSEVNDVCRTPARRVPIETVLARGTSSLQRTVQLSTGSDPSQLGRFPTTRTLIFTRPALDDPSRSPAKRVPVTDLPASPPRENQTQSSPTRFSLRTGSASVEPRPLGSVVARSQSAEPCPTISKSGNDERSKEPVFPKAPMPPIPRTKLPFPLLPVQKPGSDLPPSIPEEREGSATGNTEAGVMLGRLSQDTMSQLRQPSANSRIPRIGNKPYARPPPKGKAAVDTTTVHTICASKAPSLQLTHKNSSRVGNSTMQVSCTQPANDLLSVGSLKRKRGAEAMTSNSRPVMIRQVVPGILSEKYAPKPAKIPSQVQPPSESSPPKVTQPLKFRKVVDGMLSARYGPTKANPPQTEVLDSILPPPSPLSDLSSSSNDEPSDEKPSPAHTPNGPNSETSDPLRGGTSVVEPSTSNDPPSRQDVKGSEPSSRPRRTSRTRKPAQQQYVLDVFNGNTSTRPSSGRRKSQPRAEGDGFMGMSATALKALTTSNTTKNQQTVAVLATELVRKEGPRPESPTVKVRTVLQKQRDERDTRRKERAQKRAQMSESLGASGIDGLDDGLSLDGRADHDENDYAMLQKHRLGPGDEEDYETPERPERAIEPLRLEGADRKVKPVKQVKWHRGLSTTVYLDEVDPRPGPLPKNVVARGCLAPTSKNLSLDPLGNLVDIDNRPFPGLVTEQIIVKKYLYDNDIEPEPIPTKTTRSKSKKK